MSYATTEWVRALDVPRAQKTVLTALAGHQNRKTGLCCPGHSTLAKDTGYSERTVRRHLSWLREAKLITTEARFIGGKKSSDGYVFNLEWVDMASGQVGQRPKRPEAKKDVASGQNLQVVPLIDEPEEEPEVLMPKPIVGFAQFWIVWPRKDSKKTAESAWNKAIKRADPALIVEMANAYANHPDRPAKQFVPYGATWLNAERWNDPLPEAPEADRQRLSQPQRNLELVREMERAANSDKEIAS